MSYLVFISHATTDQWVARQISNLIEQKGKRYGVKTFFDDKNIEGGQHIPEVIRQNLADCDEFLVLFSSESITRPWVLQELGAAWGMRKRIIALLDKLSAEELPDTISEYKAFKLNDFEQYLEELIARARRKTL